MSLVPCHHDGANVGSINARYQNISSEIRSNVGCQKRDVNMRRTILKVRWCRVLFVDTTRKEGGRVHWKRNNRCDLDLCSPRPGYGKRSPPSWSKARLMENQRRELLLYFKAIPVISISASPYHPIIAPSCLHCDCLYKNIVSYRFLDSLRSFSPNVQIAVDKFSTCRPSIDAKLELIVSRLRQGNLPKNP